MPKVHSHYENLKVARDAKADDVRLAYRALTRRHHPDRNPGNAESERIMSVVNVAYDVLSDPARRLEHDRWIEQSEQAELTARRSVRVQPSRHVPSARYQAQSQAAAPDTDPMASQRARQFRFDRNVRRGFAHLRRFWPGYGLASIGLLYAAISAGPQAFPNVLGLAAAGAPPVLAEGVPGYTRPAAAPNGRLWPAGSGYLEGYERLNDGGLSEVVIDNSLNDTDMFVKLVSLDGPTPYPVRNLLVAARSRFTVSSLSIGTYDLRYRNLGSGGLLRSPAFIVEEVHTPRGTQQSKVTLRLHRAGDGHLQAYQLGDAEFL